jgi:hypothetical protein
MAEPTFIESYELADIASQLQKRYMYELGHVDLDCIYFAEKIGEKGKKAQVVSISGINSPWLKQLLSKADKHNKLYCLSAWSQEWGQLSPAQKQWGVFDMLYSVALENNGKLRKCDVVGHGPIIEFLGPYWRFRKDLPDMLNDDPLGIPPPPEPIEDIESQGSTL